MDADETNDSEVRRVRRSNRVAREQCVRLIKVATAALGMFTQLKGCSPISKTEIFEQEHCMASGCKRSRRTDDLNTPWFCNDGCNGLQSFHVHTWSFSAGGRSYIFVSWAFDMELQQVDLVV